MCITWWKSCAILFVQIIDIYILQIYLHITDSNIE